MPDDNDPQTQPARNANGQFGPGNPGRPRGSRNGSSQRAMRAILGDFDCNQDEFLRTLREQYPVEYVRMITKVLPRQVEVEAPSSLEDWTQEELARAYIEAKRLLSIETDPRVAILGLEAILSRPHADAA